MHSFPIIHLFYEVRDPFPDIRKCLVVEEIHFLVLKRLEEAFRGSIIIRIAFPCHADSEAMPVQFVDILF